RGSHLTEALEWRNRGEPALNPLEREFLDASAARRTRDRAGRRHRIELAFVALAVALAAITVVAIVALYQGREAGRQRRHAERERNVAVSSLLASESANTLDADPELGLSLAMWAFDTSPTDQADVALRNATLAFRQRAVLPADPLTAEAAAYSPDGKRVVTGG